MACVLCDWMTVSMIEMADPTWANLLLPTTSLQEGGRCCRTAKAYSITARPTGVYFTYVAKVANSQVAASSYLRCKLSTVDFLRSCIALVKRECCVYTMYTAGRVVTHPQDKD